MDEIIFYISKDGSFYFFCLFMSWYFVERGCMVKYCMDDKKIISENKKNKIIIPYGIYQQANLFNSNIYYDLDNKSKCYELFKKYKKFFESSGIKLIKHYTKEYIHKNKPNIKKKFIIKPNNGKGSNGIIYIEDYIYTLINKYQDYQIQDIIENDCGFEFSCGCVNGKIISHICIKTKIIKRSCLSYLKGITGEVVFNQNIFDFVKKFVSKIKYNGFVEFEFISKKNFNYKREIYFMECNSRISGWVNNEYFFDKIILPYIKKVYQIQIESKKYDETKKIIFSDLASRINLIKNSIRYINAHNNITNKRDFYKQFLKSIFA
jgi:hypothetical protein